MWLDGGAVRLDGPTSSTIDAYLGATRDEMGAKLTRGLGNGPLRVHDVRVVDGNGAPVDVMQRDRAFAIEVEYELAEAVPALDVAISVTNDDGVRVLEEAMSETTTGWRGYAGRFVARFSAVRR